MNFADIFNGDAFTVDSLSQSINLVPTDYGRLNQMGLFANKDLATTVAIIEFDNNIVNLIPATPRGSAAPKSRNGKRTAVPIEIPRLALDDVILPGDIQNVRAFGGVELQTVESVTNDKLVKLARKHDITHEYLNCGAITGIILDASGAVLADVFQSFNLTRKTVNINFSDANEDVDGKLDEIMAHIEDNLMGDTMTGVHVLCSKEWFDGLIKHPKVKEAYANYLVQTEAAKGFAIMTGHPMRDNVRKGFVYKGFVFEEYRGNASYVGNDGVSATRRFIAENKAQFFPVGTTETFTRFNAPADWLETVNTIAVPRYAKVVPEAGNRYAEVLSQSSGIPICTRPKVLVESANAA